MRYIRNLLPQSCDMYLTDTHIPCIEFPEMVELDRIEKG